MQSKLVTMTPELKSRIEKEAAAHARHAHAHINGPEYNGYVAGYTAAIEKAEKLREALADIAGGKALPHLIAQHALEQYKKETE